MDKVRSLPYERLTHLRAIRDECDDHNLVLHRSKVLDQVMRMFFVHRRQSEFPIERTKLGNDECLKFAHVPRKGQINDLT
jgi:hypothetical protein